MKTILKTLTASALLAVSGFTAIPVNPDATPEVWKVLDYLSEVSSHNKILSGQESPFDMQYARHIQEVTGKWPAIIGLDFYCEDTVSLRPGMIATAIEYWRAGGLVTICWHAMSPLEMEPDSGGWESVRSSMSQSDFDQVVTPGTELYNRWAKNVDIIAAMLQQLRDSGVVVLWRPYHEMNGNWFWWGDKKPSSFRKLWHNMFDRLTCLWELNNLIWVWSPGTGFDAAYYQPDLMDVGGVDHYTPSQHDSKWLTEDASLSNIMGGKPYSITECGLVPHPEAISVATGYSWFLVWAFGWCDNTAFGMPPANGPGNAPEDLIGIYQHPVCITRDEVFADLDSLSGWACTETPPAELPNPFQPAPILLALNRLENQETHALEERIPERDAFPYDLGFNNTGMNAYLSSNSKPLRTKKPTFPRDRTKQLLTGWASLKLYLAFILQADKYS